MIRLKKVFNLTEEEIVLTNEIAEAINKEPKVETHEVNINFIDVLPIIPNPHNLGLSENIDPLSLIYSKFVSETDIPPALPIFSFLSYLSAFSVNNNIMYKHPTSPADYLNTWL